MAANLFDAHFIALGHDELMLLESARGCGVIAARRPDAVDVVGDLALRGEAAEPRDHEGVLGRRRLSSCAELVCDKQSEPE
eukprot:2704254-Pleurochrysis_carterae.AAC.2